MKKLTALLSSLALVFTFSAQAFAQAGSQTAEASADVVSELSFTKEANLSFGKISANNTSNASIDPNVDGSGNVTADKSSVGTGNQLGHITVITGTSSGQAITMWTDSPSTLDGESTATESIDFSGNYLAVDGGGNTSKELPADGTKIDVTTTNDSGSNYDYEVYLGGSLTSSAPSSQTYSGTITLNVDYQ